MYYPFSTVYRIVKWPKDNGRQRSPSRAPERCLVSHRKPHLPPICRPHVPHPQGPLKTETNKAQIRCGPGWAVWRHLENGCVSVWGVGEGGFPQSPHGPHLSRRETPVLPVACEAPAPCVPPHPLPHSAPSTGPPAAGLEAWRSCLRAFALPLPVLLISSRVLRADSLQ